MINNISGHIYRVSLFFVLCCAVMANAGSVSTEQTSRNDTEGMLAEMNLQVSNIQSPAGTIRIAIYRVVKGQDWQLKAYRYAEIDSLTTVKPASIALENMPFGRYAIKLFHDINGNQEIDINESGLPVEPFALSWKDKNEAAMPDLREAIFDFSQSGQIIPFELIQVDLKNQPGKAQNQPEHSK